MKVEFKHTTNFLGRNGMFKCTGLSVWTYEKHSFEDKGPVKIVPMVWIEPWTSRKTVGRCFIEIPAEDLPRLIEVLQIALTGVDNG